MNHSTNRIPSKSTQSSAGIRKAMETVDLRGVSYEGFVSFWFDHPVVPVPEHGSGQPEPWYCEVKGEEKFDPIELAPFYIRLFSDPVPALVQFTDEQIDQGFWAILCWPILDCAVPALIWTREIPFEVRATLVRSMFHLFEKFFSVKSQDASDHNSWGSAYMWWDLLAHGPGCDMETSAERDEGLLMQDVLFETLQRVVRLPSRDVQWAALHGFGHLRHPGTPKFIEAWLHERRDVDDELAAYARAAARFEVV